QHAVDHELHGLGVERRPIVKTDIVTQVEGPGSPVFGYDPALCERRYDFALRVVLHQAVVDMPDGIKGRLIDHVLRVQLDRFRIEGVDQLGTLYRAATTLIGSRRVGTLPTPATGSHEHRQNKDEGQCHVYSAPHRNLSPS